MLEVDMEIIYKRPRGYSVPSGCGKGSGVLVADRTVETIVLLFVGEQRHF